MVHREQFGGANNHLPINILKRSTITYYSINFSLHKNFYNFYDAKKTVDDFALSFERVFVRDKKVKTHGSIELVDYQPTEIIELESRRIWMTYIYVCKFFNEFVKGEIKNDSMKRVTVNEMTGSSWRFKRFERVSNVVTNISKKPNVSS